MLEKTAKPKSARERIADHRRKTPSDVPASRGIGQARRSRDGARPAASLDERLKTAAKESFGLMGED